MSGKLTHRSTIEGIQQLYQAYQVQSDIDREQDRIPFEIAEQIMKDAGKAKSNEERMKIMRPFKEQQDRDSEKYMQRNLETVAIYRQKFQLDAALILKELLRRLGSMPARKYSPSANRLEHVFIRTQTGYDLRDIITELQFLASTMSN